MVMTPAEMFIHELKKERDKVLRKQATSNALRTEDYHWTDASQYAEEYYGERMRQTTRFDDDWG